MYPVGSLIDLIDQQVWNMSFILLSYCYVPFSDQQLSVHIFIGNWIVLFISIFPKYIKICTNNFPIAIVCVSQCTIAKNVYVWLFTECLVCQLTLEI